MTDQTVPATPTDLAAEVERLRAEVARLRDAQWQRELETLELLRTAARMHPAPDGQEVLVARWDRTVIHPDPDSGDDTVVCCLTADRSQPVALLLSDDHREALAGALLDADDGQVCGDAPDDLAAVVEAAGAGALTREQIAAIVAAVRAGGAR